MLDNPTTILIREYKQRLNSKPKEKKDNSLKNKNKGINQKGSPESISFTRDTIKGDESFESSENFSSSYINDEEKNKKMTVKENFMSKSEYFRRLGKENEYILCFQKYLLNSNLNNFNPIQFYYESNLPNKDIPSFFINNISIKPIISFSKNFIKSTFDLNQFKEVQSENKTRIINYNIQNISLNNQIKNNNNSNFNINISNTQKEVINENLLQINQINRDGENLFNQFSELEIAKHSIHLINEKKGCKLIQDTIKHNKKFTNELLFKELIPKLPQICCDQYGNYLLQALLYELTQENLKLFFSVIFSKNYFYSICLSQHGSRVIQALIDITYNKNELLNKLIIKIYSTKFCEICLSRYGNYVMQKLLSKVHFCHNNNIDIIYQLIFKNFMTLVNTKYGVCVVQKCLSDGNSQQRLQTVKLIMENFDYIIYNDYGCYLLQYFMTISKDFEEERVQELIPVIKKIEGGVESYIKNKNSAAVIEKCCEQAHDKIRQHFLEFIIKNKKEIIIEMLLDKNENYIIQKALINENNEIIKNDLMNIILSNAEILRENYFGNKIITKIMSSQINSNKVNNSKKSHFINKSSNNKGLFLNYSSIVHFKGKK